MSIGTRKVWLMGLATVVLLGGCGSVGELAPDSMFENSEESNLETVVLKPETGVSAKSVDMTDEDPIEYLKLGEEGILEEKFSVTPLSIKEEVLKEHRTMNEKVLSVEFEVKNISEEKQTVSSLVTMLVSDSKGYEHSPLTLDGKDTFSKTLKKGESAKGVVYFDIPYAEEYPVSFAPYYSNIGLDWKLDWTTVVAES